ncbi:MAG: ethanolamine utilization protein EutQ (cupin superfamily) [Yoonia sp.]|jgi:ethanolamine utilization protein EutQ (cupin superfamily)
MNVDQNMSDLAAIKPEDRRVANVREGKFVTLLSDGVADGSVLQLNDAKPLGTGFHVYRMAAGETTIAHKHASDEEFYIIEGDIVDHDGTEYGQGDLVWLRKGTEHTSYSPNGCLIVVYLEDEES